MPYGWARVNCIQNECAFIFNSFSPVWNDYVVDLNFTGGGLKRRYRRNKWGRVDEQRPSDRERLETMLEPDVITKEQTCLSVSCTCMIHNLETSVMMHICGGRCCVRLGKVSVRVGKLHALAGRPSSEGVTCTMANAFVV